MKKIALILLLLFAGCATTTQTVDKCDKEKKECCSKK